VERKRKGKDFEGKAKQFRMRYQHKMEDIFIAREASWHNSNGHHFDYLEPTQLRRFGNHVPWVNYLERQATIPASKNRVQIGMTAVQ
jgi:hypothetical protein